MHVTETLFTCHTYRRELLAGSSIDLQLRQWCPSECRGTVQKRTCCCPLLIPPISAPALTMGVLNNLDAQNEVGIIGMGSMGGGMALLFSQHGSRVACFDVKTDMLMAVLERAKEDKDIDEYYVHGYDSLEKLLRSFKRGHPRVLVFSLPHGPIVDTVISQIEPYLAQGDIILDCGNEWWEDTERRQGRALARGVIYFGCGVSGGYQAARHGPSMSPGGDKSAYAALKPLLEKWSAKTPSGEP